MKQHLVLLFFFAATTAFAQTKKFSVGISVMPLWSNLIISRDGKPHVYREDFNGTPGFVVLAMGEYQIKKRLALRTGLGYLRTGGYYQKIENLTWPQPSPNNPIALQSKLIHSDFITPIILKLHFGRRLNWYGLIGGTNVIMIARTEKMISWYPGDRVETDKMDISGTENYRKLNHSGIIGGGYELHLTPKVHLFVEPTFTYNIGTVVKDVLFPYRTYTAGLNTGIRF